MKLLKHLKYEWENFVNRIYSKGAARKGCANTNIFKTKTDK